MGSPVAELLADRFSRSRSGLEPVLRGAAYPDHRGQHGVGELGFLRVSLDWPDVFIFPAAFALMADYHGVATRGKAMSLLSAGAHLGFGGRRRVAAYLAQHSDGGRHSMCWGCASVWPRSPAGSA